MIFLFKVTETDTYSIHIYINGFKFWWKNNKLGINIIDLSSLKSFLAMSL